MVIAYNTNPGAGLVSGISNGMGLREAYDAMQRRKGLAAGMKTVANGDETGWGQVAENAPEMYMKKLQQDQILQQKQEGGGWTTDLGRMWSIANDPNQTEQNRQLASQYLNYIARNPQANADWSGAGRIGTLQADLALGGQIEAQKTLAREQAKGEIENTKKAQNLQRNMESFNEMANELINLADKATYTKAGQLRDSFLRQTGQPMSEGGIAREKYNEIVKNELLPKLRETFGGQLSDSEREALLGTLGNVNLSPEEKKQAVQAFIEAKERQLRSYGVTPRDILKNESQEKIYDWRDI